MKFDKTTDSVTARNSIQSKTLPDLTQKIEKKDVAPSTALCVCGHSIKYPNCDGNACWGWD